MQLQTKPLHWGETKGQVHLECSVVRTGWYLRDRMCDGGSRFIRNLGIYCLIKQRCFFLFNPLNAELNPICYLLALLAHHFLHVRRVRVKSLTLRLLMSYIYIYIYMERLFLMFLDHTQPRSTVGKTPLDEWSARRRDLYLTTHDTHNR